jgi:hypothetical protein
MAVDKVLYIATRFIIPSEDTVLNMTDVITGIQTRTMRGTYMLLQQKFLMPALDAYRKSV